MSTHFSMNTAEVVAAATKLHAGADALRGSLHIDTVPGAADWAEIAAPAADFHETWVAALNKVADDIEALSTAASGAAQAVESDDHDRSAGWRTLEGSNAWGRAHASAAL